MVFYDMMESQIPAYHKLFQSEEYSEFRRKLRDEYFSLDYFKALSTDPTYSEIISAYIADASEGIYRRWKASLADQTKDTIEDLAKKTSDMLMGGLKSLEEKNLTLCQR